MNLLIVDDDILCVEGIMASVDWERLEFDKVLVANSYSEAVNLFGAESIDVMLCDIEMPYANGIHLVSWVKEQKYPTECIFLTCHDEFDFAKQAISLHCFDYLLKPVMPQKLVAVLAAVTEKIRENQKNQYYYAYGQKYVESMSGQEEEDEDSNPGRVQKIQGYILEHISEDLSVEQLAALVYISPNHLTRLFKKETGKTLIDYITGQRMFLAKELLEQNKLSVSMVSARVGYGNYSYFTKAFKKVYGKTPRDYRAWFLRENS